MIGRPNGSTPFASFNITAFVPTTGTITLDRDPTGIVNVGDAVVIRNKSSLSSTPASVTQVTDTGYQNVANSYGGLAASAEIGNLIGKRVGRKALREVACVAKPYTILAWYRWLVGKKFDGSKHRQYPGRPTVPTQVEALVVRMVLENTGWGYDRIVGALANLGHGLSDQTVGNILRCHRIAPAPKRSQTTSWRDFIAVHMNVLAGADFFTVEVLSWRGLVTYNVLFFIHLESRRVSVAGITRHPDQEWMEQIARSATQETWGYLHPCRYVLHDRDT